MLLKGKCTVIELMLKEWEGKSYPHVLIQQGTEVMDCKCDMPLYDELVGLDAKYSTFEFDIDVQPIYKSAKIKAFQ